MRLRPQRSRAHAGHADDAAVSGRQGGVSRCAAAVSHGRLLRAVRRRRQDGRPRARPGADQPRQGRKRGADGRLSLPSARKLPGQADRRRAAGGDLRAGRRRQAGQGAGAARGDAGRHAGTLTDDALLDPRASNYLAAVVPTASASGLAWVELSTGRFHAAAFPPPRAGRRAGADRPGRVPGQRRRRLPATATSDGAAMVTRRPAWAFSADTARDALLKHFGTASARRVRLRRRRRAGDPRGRRGARLSGRNAEGVAGAHRPAGAATRPATRWRSTKRRAAAWRSRARSATAAAKARCWP